MVFLQAELGVAQRKFRCGAKGVFFKEVHKIARNVMIFSKMPACSRDYTCLNHNPSLIKAEGHQG